MGHAGPEVRAEVTPNKALHLTVAFAPTRRQVNARGLHQEVQAAEEGVEADLGSLLFEHYHFLV